MYRHDLFPPHTSALLITSRGLTIPPRPRSFMPVLQKRQALLVEGLGETHFAPKQRHLQGSMGAIVSPHILLVHCHYQLFVCRLFWGNPQDYYGMDSGMFSRL